MFIGFFIYVGFVGVFVSCYLLHQEISRHLESAYPKDSDIVCCWCGMKHNENNIEKIRNDNKRLCRYYFNPGAFKKDVKKMVTLANGKTEQEKLSEDWQRVSDDFARAWEKVISEKAKRSAE